MALEVTPQITIDESELEEQFIRASGPGGQNVNKVASAVQLRWNVRRTPALPEDVRQRLLRQARNRINAEGELVIAAGEFRTQEQNRRAARERLASLVRRAAEKPRRRKPTRPGRAAEERRLESKRCRSQKKRRRRYDPRQDF